MNSQCVTMQYAPPPATSISAVLGDETFPIELDDDSDPYDDDELQDFNAKVSNSNVFDLDGELSDGEHPELGFNWRMRALFNGRVADQDLPPNCKRPQTDQGRSFPAPMTEPRLYQGYSTEMFTNSEVFVPGWDDAPMYKTTNPTPFFKKMTATSSVTFSRPVSNWPSRSATTISAATSTTNEQSLSMQTNSGKVRTVDEEVVTNIASSSQGYVLANGRTWVRKKPENYDLSRRPDPKSAYPPSAHKKTQNQSMRIINGKRIYTGSNECFRFAESGQCPNGVLCVYEHNGSTEHQTRKICSKLLRGLCRNDVNCPDGDHYALLKHQLPVCDFYLRMMCVQENCPYLHVKHTDGTNPCAAFNRGCCNQGIMCNQPHRYYYNIIKERGDQKEQDR